MVGSFAVDEERKEQEIVRRVVKEINPEESHGGATRRFYWKKDVFKVMRHEEGEVSLNITIKNSKILDDLGIPFPDTIVGEYDLRAEGYWKDTPVIIQECADRSLDQTFHNGNATKETLMLLEGAVRIVDLACEAGIVLDNSLQNFGLFGSQVAFLDFQDKNSMKKGTDAELHGMYEALKNSLHGRIPENGKDPMQIIKENSRVLK